MEDEEADDEAEWIDDDVEDEYAAQEAQYASSATGGADPLALEDPFAPLNAAKGAKNAAAASGEDATATDVNSSPAAATPRRIAPRIDWLLCDIVCYPARALALVRRWLEADAVQCGMIITVKMQREGSVAAEEDAAGDASSAAATTALPPRGPVQQYHLAQQATVLAQLRAIPNSRLVHLHENKNECTFIWIRPVQAS